MAKSSQRAPPHEPLPPINHLLSAKETIPEALVGKDITKPRDLYTFLSLGYLPINSVQWPKDGNTAIHPDDKKVTFSLSTITTSSKQWDDPFPHNSYVQFDAHNPITGLPVLPSISRVSSATCDNDADHDSFDIDPLLIQNGPRQSLINEEDHRIKISTTYIFAPTERLHETVKYNRNVTLPKIKPKKNPPGTNSQSNSHVTDQKTSNNSIKTTEPSSLTPRKTDMQPGNSLFGMRPECIFLNNQLGARNPLLRQTKESPSQLVPKAGTGLNDLKDYDEYPEAYWELRDGTIREPEDLEADMIDRDLYRLRQISSLKLNTIERTFQVAQDPFRKWRGKAVEPVFSPRQQQRRLRRERMKVADIPIYPQHMLKTMSGMNMPRLRIPKNNNDKKNDSTPLATSCSLDSFRQTQQQEVAVTSGGNELALPTDVMNNETPVGSNTATPREMLVASLDTYRRLEEEREERLNGDDLPIQKLHELKGKKEKKVIKTPLAHVDLDSLETYRREHRAAPKRFANEHQNGRSLNNSVNRESFGQTSNMNDSSNSNNSNNNINNNNMISPKLDTARSSFNDKSPDEKTATVDQDELSKSNGIRKGSDSTSIKQPIKAPVASILFHPQNKRVSDVDILESVQRIHMTLYDSPNYRPGISSPNVSDSSIIDKDKAGGANTPLKAVNLQVFAERADPRSPIKIPTGRTTYHPNMPSCRLDLMNYPPSNARQSCRVRSNSAGLADGRQTQLTLSTQPSRHRLESSETRVGNQSTTCSAIPPKSSDNSGVNIRFGRQGKVIVSSSREGRRSVT